MEPLHYLALAGQDFDHSRSALPDAPVIACSRPERTHAVREALAHSLHRLGDAVAPSSGSTTEPVAA